MKYEWLVFVRHKGVYLGFEFSSRKKAELFCKDMDILGVEWMMCDEPIRNKPKRKRKK